MVGMVMVVTATAATVTEQPSIAIFDRLGHSRALRVVSTCR
jgi:hypothetical protein